jgi:hypothetical protein
MKSRPAQDTQTLTSSNAGETAVSRSGMPLRGSPEAAQAASIGGLADVWRTASRPHGRQGGGICRAPRFDRAWRAWRGAPPGAPCSIGQSCPELSQNREALLNNVLPAGQLGDQKNGASLFGVGDRVTHEREGHFVSPKCVADGEKYSTVTRNVKRFSMHNPTNGRPYPQKARHQPHSLTHTEAPTNGFWWA